MKSEPFWQWYDTVAAPRLGFRAATFRKMFEHLDSLDRPVTIVETGCVRIIDNWEGDGQSTLLFDKYASAHPGSIVHSIDIDPVATTACAAMVSDVVSVHTGDSVDVLRHIQQSLVDSHATLDLLYLDSFDLDVNNPIPSAVHHLKELVSIAGAITNQTLVVVDDSPLVSQVVDVDGVFHLFGYRTIGGKGKYVAEYARQIGATNLFASYQIGWTGMSARR